MDDNKLTVIESPSVSNSELMIKEAEQFAAAFRRLRQVAVGMTKPGDWIDMGGKPYLQAPGAERIIAVFGISVTDVTKEKTFDDDADGQYYTWTYSGTFSLKNGTSIRVDGTCSSRNKFFGVKNSEFKAMEDVDQENIKRAAYSKMYTVGIGKILGIRNMTWDDLKEFGIGQDNVAKVSYAKTDAEKTPEQKTDEAQRRLDIRNWLLQMCGNDAKMAEEKLAEITAFKGKDGNIVAGLRRVDYLKDKRLNIAHSNVKELFAEWEAGANG